MYATRKRPRLWRAARRSSLAAWPLPVQAASIYEMVCTTRSSTVSRSSNHSSRAAGAAHLSAGDRGRSGVLGRPPAPSSGLCSWSTVRAIRGQRFIPGILDHLAARLAWDGQLYGGPPDPNQPVDLYPPVPGYQAAHGAFDTGAKDRSWELGLIMRASWVATAVPNAAGVMIRALTSGRGTSASAHNHQAQNGQHGQSAQHPLSAHQ